MNKHYKPQAQIILIYLQITPFMTPWQTMEASRWFMSAARQSDANIVQHVGCGDPLEQFTALNAVAASNGSIITVLGSVPASPNAIIATFSYSYSPFLYSVST